MPYDIRKEGSKFAVYRLPYPGEKGGEKKINPPHDTLDGAEMYVAFAEKKEKSK